MARQAGVSAENNFIRGLITETTAVKFPENACTEQSNCIFDETGRVTRRLGFDIEAGGLGTTITPVDGEAYTEYRWEAPAGNGTRSFFVQQQGSNLYFYDISSSSQVGSTSTPLGTIDLEDHVPGNSSLNAADYPCQYSTGNGDLIVTNDAIDIIYVVFDESAQAFDATSVGIFVRDFKGFPDDGYDLNERPAESGATLAANGPRHFYNILNQGWALGDALSQWDTARADMPSNVDYPGLYRLSETDAFDTSLVSANDPGNRPAPKGHFLVVPYVIDRTQTLIENGFNGIDVDPGTTEYTLNGFQKIELPSITPTTATYGAAFDTFNSQTANGCATLAAPAGALVCGVSPIAQGTSFRISEAKVYGASDTGFINGSNGQMTIDLYGKLGPGPVSSTDGFLIGTVTFNDTSDESAGRTITCTDTNTPWHHVWVHMYPTSGASSEWRVAELELFGIPLDPTNATTPFRPRCNEFFAGRAWFAGVDALGLNNALWFSQIIQTRDQYGKCYQVNDPTSENFADLLPDDGGEIRIPEMGRVMRLVSYQASLLVIASNGVWRISGTSGGFAANDYTIRKISSQGSLSPLSVTTLNGVPVWWGDDGIFTVTYSAEFDSFSVVSLTEQSIRSFYLDIPPANRAYVKGAADSAAGILYWLYNDTEDLDEDDVYTYNSVLIYNAISKAFYSWTIGDQEGVDVRGICFVQDAARAGNGVVKYTCTVNTGASTNMFWAETIDDTYVDWREISASIDVPAIDYESYFITGYRIHAEGQRYFQGNYIFVYLDDVQDGSCRMQGIYDWTNSGNSGKWSSLQQIYNPNLLNRDVNFRRLKLRGKGRAMQLRFESESGKPFSIIGWSVWETSNAGL